MREQLEALYMGHCKAGTAISPHLPRLRDLATGLDTVVEFGVKRGASSTALLLGARRVISFDIAPTPQALALQAIAGERWDYRLEDSKKADVPKCGAIFLDSLHTYEQVKGELEAHGDKAERFLIFHDHITFGVVGANGETGMHKWQYQRGQSVPLNCLGIRQAIDEFMVANRDWRIAASYPESHGLLVLERR